MSTMANTAKMITKNPNFKEINKFSDLDTNIISKIQLWVDYTLKYGMGYRLTNGAIGVLFNDMTSMLFSHPITNYQTVAYIPIDKQNT